MEESFPRGGKRQYSKENESEKSSTKRKRLSTSSSKKADRKNDKKTRTKRADSPDPLGALWTRKLNQNICVSDLLVLGCVKAITDHNVMLEFPDGFRGILSLTNISSILNERLLMQHKETKRSGLETNEIIKLNDYFTVGQLICCKLLPTPDDAKTNVNKKKFRRAPYPVTTDPKLVNSLLSIGSITEGMLLNGAIKSIEEKGYLIDLGLETSSANTIGFLPFDQCPNHGMNPVTQFHIGQVISCSVIDAPSSETASMKRVIRLSVLPIHVNGGIEFSTHRIQKEQCLPGLVVKASVEKVIPKLGLIIRLATSAGGSLRGFISKQRLENPNTQPTEYKPNQILAVCVLYSIPNSAVFGLSAEKHLTAHFGDEGGRTDLLTLGHVGDTVKGRVERTTSKAVVFEIVTKGHGGRVMGVATQSRLEMAGSVDDTVQLQYPLGSKHQLRIVGYSFLDRLFYVDTRKDVLKQPVVDVESAVPGTLVQATVWKAIKGKGIFVRLYGSIRGFVPILHCFDKPLSDVVKMSLEKKFQSGRTVQARVLYSDLEKNRVILTLKKKLVSSTSKTLVNCFNQDFVGKITDGFTVQINPDRGILVAFYGNARGWLPKIELEKCGLLADEQKLTELFYLGQVLCVRIRDVDVTKQRMVLSPVIDEDNVCPSDSIQKATETPIRQLSISRPLRPLVKCALSVGKIFTAIITKIQRLQLDLLIEHQHRGRVFVTELSDEIIHGSNPLSKYSVGQPIIVKVIQIKTKLLKSKKKRSIALKTEVLGGTEVYEKKRLYFAECTMKESKMKAKSGKRRLIGYKEEFQKGERLAVAIKEISGGHDDHGQCCHVMVNPDWKGDVPILHLSTDITALTNPCDHFVPGQLLMAKIVGMQIKEKHLQLTCLSQQESNVVIGTPTIVMVVRQNSEDKSAIKCRMVDGTHGFLRDGDLSYLKVGQSLEAYPEEKLANGQWRLSLRGINRPIVKREISSEFTFESVTKKRGPDGEDKKPELSTNAIAVSTASKRMEEAATFTWDSGRFSMENLMNVGLEEQNNGVDASEKETAEKSRAQRRSRFERAKLEEDDLLQREMALLNPDRQMDSSDDFDRLLMGSPDSSLIWIRYMAFFLQRGDVTKARAVGERALNTINVREEIERFNVWTALLNLENIHGTNASFRQTFDRAVVVNDPLKMYQLATKILSKSNKIEECDHLYDEMLSKFKSELNVWISLGDYYMLTARPDKARDLMKRAMRSQPISKHVDLISRFAQMEYRYSKDTEHTKAVGDAERGRTLFENILRDCPKRTDVWSVYIDMTSKYQDIEEARPIFERVTSMKLNIHNMRLFYKKWLDLEERLGTKETLDQVKKRAGNYVQGSLATLPKLAAMDNEDEQTIDDTDDHIEDID